MFGIVKDLYNCSQVLADSVLNVLFARVLLYKHMMFFGFHFNVVVLIKLVSFTSYGQCEKSVLS